MRHVVGINCVGAPWVPRATAILCDIIKANKSLTSLDVSDAVDLSAIMDAIKQSNSLDKIEVTVWTMPPPSPYLNTTDDYAAFALLLNH